MATKAQLKAEHTQLTGESWVILGEADGVPDWAVGQPAAVIGAPISKVLDDNGDLIYTYTDPKATIQVRERSQGATFYVPLNTCTKVSITGGRNEVVNFP